METNSLCDYFWSQAYYYSNLALDTAFDYKIQIQENEDFQNWYQFFFPTPLHAVIEAKVCNSKKCYDITDDFIDKINYKQDWEHVKWDDILDIYHDLEDMSKDNDFHLDVKYIMKDKQYRIIYKFGKTNTIKYPPYTPIDINKYEENDDFKKKILCAELCHKSGKLEEGQGDQDITDLIKEYAGPMNNFYENIDHEIHAHIIKDENGSFICLENKEIKITDNMASEYYFQKTDKIKI